MAMKGKLRIHRGNRRVGWDDPRQVKSWSGLARFLSLRFPRFDREDLIQEALIKLWISPGDAPVGTVLYRGMVDAMRSWYGRGGSLSARIRQAQRSLDVAESPDGEPGATTRADRITASNDVASEATANVLMTFATARILELTPFQQAAILLSAREETLKEIGRRFGVTEGRACQVRTDAMKILRAKFAA